MKIIKINAMWCPGCLISKNIWNEIETIYPNHEYINLDYDLDDEIVEKYKVGDILPVVIIEDNNKEIKRIIGEKNKKEILKELSDIL
ncbi:MAG: thioredoxin family protein [Bacilli bacterium]|nr:thioredoxin family protein [Bacilli bacterium]